MEIIRHPILYAIGILILIFSGSALAQDSVFLETGDETLNEVLQRVTLASGIHFQVPEVLAEMKINKRVQGPDWDEAVRQLLDNYNRLELSDDDGNLKKIFVLSLKKRGQMALTTRSEIPQAKGRYKENSEIWLNTEPLHRLAKGSLQDSSTRKTFPRRRERPMEVSEIWLNTEQLDKLAKGPFRDPLPKHLYFDPKLREFLILHKISSPDEMTNILKAMRVRVEARRQLKILHKEKLKNKD